MGYVYVYSALYLTSLVCIVVYLYHVHIVQSTQLLKLYTADCFHNIARFGADYRQKNKFIPDLYLERKREIEREK